MALVQSKALPAGCHSCGSEISAGTRFCRQCGAPAALAQPIEIELFQMTAKAGAAYKGVSAGALFVIVAMLLPLLLFFVSSDPVKFAKAVKGLTMMASFFGICGAAMLINAWWRLNRMLKPIVMKETLPAANRYSSKVPDTTNLSSHSDLANLNPVRDTGSTSVTEGTTDLLPREGQKTI